jgi:hypothetical protein
LGFGHQSGTLKIKRDTKRFLERKGDLEVLDRKWATTSSLKVMTDDASRVSPYENPMRDTDHFLKLVYNPKTCPKNARRPQTIAILYAKQKKKIVFT